MSSYTSSDKRKLNTYLDNAGAILGLTRLEDESLVDYRERLIDHVKNPGNTSTRGLNLSFAREAGLQRKHVLTLEATADTEKPYIEITSKYLRLKDDDEIDIEIDLYNKTIGNIYTTITATSDMFSVSYYDEDYENYNAIQLLYGNNIRLKQQEFLGDSKLNRLTNTYLKSIVFTGSSHRYLKDSIAEVVDKFDYYINSKEGLIYTGQNSKEIVSYLYYEMPFKLYYSPIMFYPFNDTDIDEIVKDQLHVDEDEYKLINSLGSDWINELLAEHPLTWGE